MPLDQSGGAVRHRRPYAVFDGDAEDPLAADPSYITALVACTSESGIATVLQEQNERQSDLGPADKIALNENALAAYLEPLATLRLG